MMIDRPIQMKSGSLIIDPGNTVYDTGADANGDSWRLEGGIATVNTGAYGVTNCSGQIKANKDVNIYGAKLVLNADATQVDTEVAITGATNKLKIGNNGTLQTTVPAGKAAGDYFVGIDANVYFFTTATYNVGMLGAKNGNHAIGLQINQGVKHDISFDNAPFMPR